MKPGRELDALIAEKVFGLVLRDRFTGDEIPVTASEVLLRDASGARIPHFSTDIAVAWDVVSHLKRQSLTVEVISNVTSVVCRVYREHPADHDAIAVIGVNESHAICLAALAALNGAKA
jgi:hypothetical protein